jgi:hypothetical protein
MRSKLKVSETKKMGHSCPPSAHESCRDDVPQKKFEKTTRSLHAEAYNLVEYIW